MASSGRLEKEDRLRTKIENKLVDLPQVFTEFYNDMRGDRKSFNTIDTYINYVASFMNYISDDGLKEDFYKNEIPEKIITDKFLIKYSEKLKEETASLNDDLKVRLKEKTCLELYPDLLKRLKLNNLSAKERVNSRINILFVDAIINRVSDEAKFRDDSLNNFSKESFRKYVELNKQTLNK
jgi:hypothetical protein